MFDSTDKISESLDINSTQNEMGMDDGNSNNENPLSIYLKIIMFIIYISISLIAILGNGTVVYLVIAFQRMKTVTNIFIVNLAVGDILMACLCIPFTFISNLMLQYWPFGSTLCSLVSYSQAVSVLISAYTLVAISIDRYMAILFPLKIRISTQQAQLIILLIWLVALLTPLPTALLSNLVPIPNINQNLKNLSVEIDLINNVNSLNKIKNDLKSNNEEETNQKYTCQEQWPDKTKRYYYSITLMILQYFLPLIVLIYTYTKIAYVVFGRPVAANQDQIRAHQSKQKMIKMMIFVCVIYSLCWLPLNLLIVIADVYENIWQFSYIVYVWLISHLLAMSHCSVNPFIYIWMNNKFRSGFKHIYFSLCGLTSKLNLNNKDFHNSVHNYSIQIQLTQRRPFFDHHRSNKYSNDNSNNSNEEIDIQSAIVSDNIDNYNNTNRHLVSSKTVLKINDLVNVI